MLWGDTSTFALECEISPEIVYQDSRFGRIRFWVDGCQLGDFSNIQMLDVASGYFARFIKGRGLRKSLVFANKSGKEILSWYCNVYFGDLPDEVTLKEASEFGKRYSKYLLCPGGGDTFDKYLAVLLEKEQEDWLIWKNEASEQSYEVYLKPNEVESVLSEFIEWLNKQKREAD